MDSLRMLVIDISVRVRFGYVVGIPVDKLVVRFGTRDPDMQSLIVQDFQEVFPGVSKLEIVSNEVCGGSEKVIFLSVPQWNLKRFHFQSMGDQASVKVLRLLNFEHLRHLAVKVDERTLWSPWISDWLDTVIDKCKDRLTDIQLTNCTSVMLKKCGKLEKLSILHGPIAVTVLEKLPEALVSLALGGRGDKIFGPETTWAVRRPALTKFLLQLEGGFSGNLTPLMKLLAYTYVHLREIEIVACPVGEIKGIDHGIVPLVVLQHLKAIKLRGISNLIGSFLRLPLTSLCRVEIEDCPRFSVKTARHMAAPWDPFCTLKISVKGSEDVA